MLLPRRARGATDTASGLCPALPYVVPFRHRYTMTAASPKPVKVNRMVLSPQEPLTTGGPAEELERRIQETFKVGYEHVVIDRSEEHTSELQSQSNLVCRLLLEKKK